MFLALTMWINFVELIKTIFDGRHSLFSSPIPQPFKATFRAVECTHHTCNPWMGLGWVAFLLMPMPTCQKVGDCIANFCNRTCNVHLAVGTISRKGRRPGYHGKSWEGQPQTLPILTEPEFSLQFPFFFCSTVHMWVWHVCVLSLHCDAMREYF